MPSITSSLGLDPASLLPDPTNRRAQGLVSMRDMANHLAATTGATSKSKDVGQQFEATVLRQMLDTMMPKDSEKLFGDSTAGPMWRSMMVDSLATALSKTGTMGIAQMIVKPHATEGKGR
jgi:peptidoglycan hydrolase FlgJ